MFAKCVSRTSVALVLAAALAVLPATGALAAPSASADGAATWYASLQERVAVWTETVLEALRIQPRGERPGDDVVVTVSPSPQDGGLRHVQGEEGYKLDPDG